MSRFLIFYYVYHQNFLTDFVNFPTNDINHFFSNFVNYNDHKGHYVYFNLVIVFLNFGCVTHNLNLRSSKQKFCENIGNQTNFHVHKFTNKNN